MDSTDRELLSLLRDNARLSVAALAFATTSRDPAG